MLSSAKNVGKIKYVKKRFYIYGIQVLWVAVFTVKLNPVVNHVISR